MNRNSYLTLCVLAGTTGIALMVAALPKREPQSTLPPYVQMMKEGMSYPGTDQAFFQARIDEYYSSSEDERAMKDGLAFSAQRRVSEMRTLRAEEKDRWQAAAVEFCKQHPRRCQ